MKLSTTRNDLTPAVVRHGSLEDQSAGIAMKSRLGRSDRHLPKEACGPTVHAGESF